MTFTITPEVDEAHPWRGDTVELTSAYSAAQHIGETCLADGPVGRVGLEVEAHCFDLADPMRRPEWAELSDVIAGIPPLPGGSAITVEPGGAVELSGPPMDLPMAAIAAMSADRAVLRSAFAHAGLGLVLLGADPLRPAKRVNPGDRYRAMERFFTASQTGDAGAAMMTSTASVQVNLDAGPRDGWADRVRLAHALGPTRSRPPWCSPSSRCSTILLPLTSPLRPPRSGPQHGTARRRRASGIDGCMRRPHAVCRPRPNARPPNSRNRCSSWCVRSRRHDVRPTISLTGRSDTGLTPRSSNWRKGSCDRTRETCA